jgi:anti-sigma factor RsiW
MSIREQPCEWSNAAPAYLLSALPDQDARGFEAHLDGCDACSAQLTHLRPAVDALALSVERVDPPGDLRSRVMAQVKAEADLLRAAGPEADLPRRGRSRRRARLPQLRLSPAWAAGAAALLVVAGGLGGVLVAGEDGAPSPRTVAAQVARNFAPSARAEVVVASDSATLRLSGMPQPPRGHVYQVWLRQPGRLQPQPTNALFSVRADGTATVALPTRPREAREVLVTAEPAGGSARPTSQPVLAARLT